MKYIVVTGGGISSLGKGSLTSSIGALLKACDLKVTAIKIDPYLNVDAGLFSPYEHGEVFVLDDGCEVDLDLGNYERFIDINLKNRNNITTGKLFLSIIEGERRGDYHGGTATYFPHLTGAIQEWIQTAAKEHESEVCLIELGGTVGDVEASHFIYGLRQLRKDVPHGDFCCIHMNLAPYIEKSQEFKSKPLQQSCMELHRYGLPPDILFCRTQIPQDIPDSVRNKISYFCDVQPDRVYSLPEVEHLYRVPLELCRQQLLKSLSEILHLDCTVREPLMEKWRLLSDSAENAERKVIIALVGKYTTKPDCYLSVIKALEHSCYKIGVRPEILYIESTDFESGSNEPWKKLEQAHCLLVPGGFGFRGVEGKIKAIQWAREHKMPFLGVCLGFQLAVVEYARNVAGITNAHSAEFSTEVKDLTPVVIEMLEYNPEKQMGGTMRLGLRATNFVTEKSIVRDLYGGRDSIEERHRHRSEINPTFIKQLEDLGLKFVGRNTEGTRMEIMELDCDVHPYFVGVQYHPEFLSRPANPSPPYLGLVTAGLNRSQT